MSSIDPDFVALDNICIDYQQGEQVNRIVDDLSLRVTSGKILVLSGRSGSGKSSLLYLCYGQQKPTSGTVSWFGQDIASLSEKQRQTFRRERFAYCSQEVQLLDGMSALRNVQLAGAEEVAAAECLDKLGLGNRQKSLVRVMSGGERQRVAVARAIAKHADVLVFDEPTSALDATAADRVAELLTAARDRGAAIVLGTHDEKLLAIADEVVRL